MSAVYELRHRDYTVLLFEYTPVPKILEIINPERLPVPVECASKFDRRMFFEEWYKHRVPNLRTREKRSEFNTHRLYDLMTPDCVDINYGANLADHYWICEIGTPIKWNEISFFENSFDNTDENSLWTAYGKYSPDSHTNGNLRKFWTIKNDVRYLVKYNSIQHDMYQLGAYNEVFGAKLLQKLGVPCAEYSLGFDEQIREPYSLSKCITNTTYELVPAFLLMNAFKKPNHLSYYDWFLNICKEKFHINVRKQIDEMIIFDYLIANEDRHWNNFALMRNSETMEYVGLAPLYDHEYSMGTVSNFKTITFKSNPNVQLKLVDPAHTLNITKDLIEEVWNSVYETSELHSKKNNDLERIKSSLAIRMNRLERILQNKDQLTEEQEESSFQMYTR